MPRVGAWRVACLGKESLQALGELVIRDVLVVTKRESWRICTSLNLSKQAGDMSHRVQCWVRVSWYWNNEISGPKLIGFGEPHVQIQPVAVVVDRDVPPADYF